MKLYHFINAQYGLEAIENRRLKVSRLDAINDPLEFSYLRAFDKADEEWLKGLLEHFTAYSRMLCFSRIFHNPVMWSHYADRHRGLCLGFEVNQPDALTEVTYSTDRFPMAPGTCKNPQRVQPYIQRHYSQKHPSWSYEEEVRFIIPLDATVKDGNLRFVPFTEKFRLDEVIVGAFSSLQLADVMEAIGFDVPYAVSIFRAKPLLDHVGIDKGSPFIPFNPPSPPR